MRKQILASLAIVALAVFGLETPALASTFHSCADGRVCLYDGTNYGTGSWWSNGIDAIAESDEPGASPAGCVNLTNDPGGLQWAYINNAASSIVVNPGPQWGSTNLRVYFWPNLNCTGTPVMYHQFDAGLGSDPDLRDGGFHVSDNRSNSVTSISVP